MRYGDDGIPMPPALPDAAAVSITAVNHPGKSTGQPDLAPMSDGEAVNRLTKNDDSPLRQLRDNVNITSVRDVGRCSNTSQMRIDDRCLKRYISIAHGATAVRGFLIATALLL